MSTDAPDPVETPAEAVTSAPVAVLPRHPNSTPAFVLSILGLVVIPLLSIVSFFMARSARKEIAANPGRYDAEDGQLKAAWIMSIIGLVIIGIAILAVILLVILIAVGGGTTVTIQPVGDTIAPAP